MPLRRRLAMTPALVLAATLQPAIAASGDGPQSADDRVARELNREFISKTSPANTSWEALFEAYQGMTPCPVELDGDFSAVDVWPKMTDWSAMSDWAAQNASVAEALKVAAKKFAVGLPYGADQVTPDLRDAGVYADVGLAENGSVVTNLPYLKAFKTLSVWAAVEMYRRMEAGEWTQGFDVAIDNARVLRQLCDRPMKAEVLAGGAMLIDAMSMIRDAMWTFLDDIPQEEFNRIALRELPFIKVGDAERMKRFRLPEGDRFLVTAAIDNVFQGADYPDADRMGEVFGVIQTTDSPLGRFGATKRWTKIADVHGSADASKEKLTQVYDDWYRRWNIRPYDPIQELPTEYSVLNEVRYAIVVDTISDMRSIFNLRERLIVEINGTIISAGLCGYYRYSGDWPRNRASMYSQNVSKRFDFDPFDVEYGRFLYENLDGGEEPVDTDDGRIYVSGCVLYARGRDREDSGFEEASFDGVTGDMIVWPPLRVLARDQGVID